MNETQLGRVTSKTEAKMHSTLTHSSSPCHLLLLTFFRFAQKSGSLWYQSSANLKNGIKDFLKPKFSKGAFTSQSCEQENPITACPTCWVFFAICVFATFAKNACMFWVPKPTRTCMYSDFLRAKKLSLSSNRMHARLLFRKNNEVNLWGTFCRGRRKGREHS